MTMQVELFRHENDLETGTDQDSGRRRQLLGDLGFDPVLQLLAEKSETASRFYPELTGFELEIWALFHRTYYSKKAEDWSSYRFDQVPESVLEAIKFAETLEEFDDIEIWTPEHKSVMMDIDPMVVGVVGIRPTLEQNQGVAVNQYGVNALTYAGARYFPIVRWGESLAEFTDIVHRVFRRMLDYTGFGDAPLVLPETVAEYAMSGFKKNPREWIYYEKASMFNRHCGTRKFRVNDVNICVVCGAH